MKLANALMALFLVMAIAGQAVPTFADSFGRPDGGTPSVNAPVAASPSLVPRPVRIVFGHILDVQRRLNADLRHELGDVAQGGSWRAEGAIILLSFAYGVLHAIGPGHGKFVVSTFLLSRRARILQGVVMSAAAAFVQALSAIMLVGGFVLVLRISAREVLDRAGSLELASYAFITLVGCSMIWDVATRRACCARADEPDHHHDHAHNHDHDHDHDHDHAYDHHRHPEGAGGTHPSGWLSVIATGAAVGVRPCSGAILVLLFTLANAILPVGIVATLAMGLGVAITVSVVSLTTLGVRRALAPGIGFLSAGARERASRAMAYGGAILITVFGLIQVVALVSGAISPSLG